MTLAAVFTPEHGFGAASESEKISSDTIRAGGRELPLYSLYAGGAAGSATLTVKINWWAIRRANAS